MMVKCGKYFFSLALWIKPKAWCILGKYFVTDELNLQLLEYFLLVSIYKYRVLFPLYH
jgi:hypothetical protein